MAFSNHDVVPDSPINNFATLNPLNKSSSITLSNGNLKVSGSGASWDHCISNFFVPNGKFYFEVHLNGTPSGTSGYVIGLCNNLFSLTQKITTGTPDITNFVGRQGTALFNHSSLNNSFFNAMSADSIMRVYYDGTNASSKKIWFSSTSVAGDEIIIDSGITGDLFILIGVYGSSITPILNAGQDPTFGGAKSPATTYPDANGLGQFHFQPPAGALALCTKNLPEGPIKLSQDQTPSDNFKALTYTGTANTLSITNVGFKPDLIWIKRKSGTYNANHCLFDSVRGTSGNNFTSPTLFSSSTSSEQVKGLASFDDSGFTVSSYDSGGEVNATLGGATHVAWSWKAGGAPQADNSNTSGAMTANSVSLNGTLQSNYTPAGSPTIYPTRMSINTDAGFSIVKYGGSNTTGLLSSSVSSATIPHGLNDCEFCIIKNIKWSNTWVVSHRSIAPNVMSLQSTGQANSTPPVDSTYGQITTLGSNTVTITRGTSRGDNVGEDHAESNGQFEYIMYCWHSVEGYSKFGSYTGNGSADGPFVECGFRPAWVMVKRTDSSYGGDWVIFDTSRDEHNPAIKRLYANDPTNEGISGNIMDVLSNGFKMRSANFNITNANLIFMAFAEQPFSGPSNAR